MYATDTVCALIDTCLRNLDASWLDDAQAALSEIHCSGGIGIGVFWAYESEIIRARKFVATMHGPALI